MLGGALDDWMTRTDSSGTNAMLRDGISSTLGVVNSSGALATQFTYEPFGRTTFSGSVCHSRACLAREESRSARWPGSFGATPQDDASDTPRRHFLRARYYNPVLQRFLSPDPIGFGGGSPNLYAYAFNSPTNFIDPTGLAASGCGGGGGGGGGYYRLGPITLCFNCAGEPPPSNEPPTGSQGIPRPRAFGAIPSTTGSGIGGGGVGVGANERLTAQLNASSGLAMVGGVAGGLVGSLFPGGNTPRGSSWRRRRSHRRF